MLPHREEEGGAAGWRRFPINDNADLLAEVLGRLDGRSLAAAGCVCRLWNAVGRREAVWEAVCHRHVAVSGAAAAGGTRSVVAALGGYRRLYRLCIGPALDRLAGVRRQGPAVVSSASSSSAARRVSLSLALSLFSIDCYERLGGVGGRQQQQQQRPASLLFLCKPVDVS
ncbi:F-box protein SNE-like [Curcuma longa]|uniref:F-box protein SNE-like n=1 Tax=Curcuma longa TaxID=136217 RepID=UPI003D9EBF6B